MVNTTAKIKQIKGQLELMLNGNASRLQFHPVDEVISAYGHQLTGPRYLLGNADQWGNGRYVVAEYRSGAWATIHGEALTNA